MPNLFRNNAATTLANPVLTSDTTLVLATNTGARFPTPVIGEWFFVTVQSGVNFEIMKCTARAGDILTVERAQDGSSLQNWLAGDSVDMRIPRITLENFVQKNEVALLAAGAAAAPSVSFWGDADTGALNPGTNQYAIATGGAVRLLVDASSYVGVNTLTPARQFEVASPNNHMRFSVPGDATAYYDFGRDNTDGFFFFNGAQPTFVGYKWLVNGAERLRLSATGQLQSGPGTAAAPAISFGDTDTGIYGAVGQISFSIDGAEKFRIASDRAIMRNAEPMFMADKAASGADSIFRGATNNSTRWDLILGNSAAEAGSNAGSDFAINRCNDAGAYLSTPVFISRATGAIALVGPVTVDGKALQIQRGTEQSLSGASIDFTGIPAGVRRVTLFLNGASTNGTSLPSIQIGDSGGVENTGYAGHAHTLGSSGGLSTSTSKATLIGNQHDAADLLYGKVVLELGADHTWFITSQISSDASFMSWASYRKALSPGPLDRIRLTTVNETDVYDGGTGILTWEF